MILDLMRTEAGLWRDFSRRKRCITRSLCWSGKCEFSVGFNRLGASTPLRPFQLYSRDRSRVFTMPLSATALDTVRVRDLRALAVEHQPYPMEHHQALLLRAPHRDKAHGRPGDRLADCVSIGCIVLSALDVGLHMLRRYRSLSCAPPCRNAEREALLRCLLVICRVCWKRCIHRGWQPSAST